MATLMRSLIRIYTVNIKTKVPPSVRFNIVAALQFWQTYKSTVALSIFFIAAVLIILMINSMIPAISSYGKLIV